MSRGSSPASIRPAGFGHFRRQTLHKRPSRRRGGALLAVEKSVTGIAQADQIRLQFVAQPFVGAVVGVEFAASIADLTTEPGQALCLLRERGPFGGEQILIVINHCLGILSLAVPALILSEKLHFRTASNLRGRVGQPSQLARCDTWLLSGGLHFAA